MSQKEWIDKLTPILGTILLIALVAAIWLGWIDIAAIFDWIVGAIEQYLFWAAAITIGAIIITTCFPGLLVIIVGCIVLILGIFLFSAIAGIASFFG